MGGAWQFRLGLQINAKQGIGFALPFLVY